MQFLKSLITVKMTFRVALVLMGIVAGNLAFVPSVTADVIGPIIVIQPVSQGVVVGATATFSVTAIGTGPLVYQWNKNGLAISGATSSTYTTPAETVVDDRAQFNVIVFDSFGSVASNHATLTVTPATLSSTSSLPVIMVQPVSQETILGQSAIFFVTASGTGPLFYQWFKNGAPVTGATSLSYVSPPVTTTDDRAQFNVAVSNSAGSIASNSAILTVLGWPVITAPSTSSPQIPSQPISQAIFTGQSATFLVAASGEGLQYQWSKNGLPIQGATSSSYTTPPLLAADDRAKFGVAVSNSAGTTISGLATLTVTGIGSFSASASSLNFGNVVLGVTGRLNVILQNSGGSAISISNVSISGAGFSASGIPSGLIIDAGQNASLDITFTPASAAAITGSVTVTGSTSPITISLFGIGVAAPSRAVTLNWDPSSSVISGYHVYRSDVSGQFYSLLSPSPVISTRFIDETVQSGQTYHYVVTSVDFNNHQSVFSNEASISVP
jgi:hypothetical protein